VLERNRGDVIGDGAASELEATGNDDDIPLVKKRRLEVDMADSNRGDVEPASEPKLAVEDNSAMDSNTLVKDTGLHNRVTGGSGKRSRMKTHDTERAGELSDRRRNKSTSAAVLLGLVKSRVRKLVAERIEAADKSSRSTSETALTDTSSQSSTSNPQTSTPPGECSVFIL